MSEEKLYAVKNDKGKYWDFNNAGFWRREIPGCYATTIKKGAGIIVNEHGGHVVALIEEPEKVVLTKEQAIIVENAHSFYLPARYISTISCEDEEELLMRAYVNGYTVASEKKYNVKVPHSEGWHFQKYSSESKLGARNNWKPFPTKDIDFNISKELYQFTEAEIEHYDLQDCEREEVEDE